MTFTYQRRDGVLIGARCDHCREPINARTEAALSKAKAAHQCAAHYFARPREGV